MALADDANGVTWWNPAGLGFLQKPTVDLTYAALVPGLASDVSYNYLAYAQPVEGWGAFGVGIVFLSYGTSLGTDINGQETGEFGSNEFSPALYYGTRLLPDLSIGAALKFIRIQLAPDDRQGVGSTFGLDLAALYKMAGGKVSLGLNVQNLGPSVTFINEDQASPLSRNIKTGVAYEAYTTDQFKVTVAGDFNQSLVTSDFRSYHGGFELMVGNQLAGRFGYYSDPLGEIGDITYGIGVLWKSVSLDFGSIPQARDSGLDNVNKITLGYRF